MSYSPVRTSHAHDRPVQERRQKGLVLVRLKPGAYTTIDRLAQVLNSSHNSRVVIEGHTDSVGSAEMNQSLSEQRALSVESALLQRGVSGSQLRSLGKGESTPVAGNDTGSGRQANRRVELIFSQDGSRVASEE